jgi:hypothetical protein
MDKSLVLVMRQVPAEHFDVEFRNPYIQLYCLAPEQCRTSESVLIRGGVVLIGQAHRHISRLKRAS